MSAPLPSFRTLLARLRPDVADRVLERAAIIAEACGVPYAEADLLAYAFEAQPQRSLPEVR